MAGKERCGEYNQILSAYLDGEVTPAERTELLQHLAVCPDCRARLEEYRAIGTRIRGLPPVVVPETLTASVYMHTVDAPPRRLQVLTSRVAYPAAAIAAVLLVFIVAAFLLVDGYQRRIDPTIVGSTPANGVMWRTSDPIRISFNKEMDKESVESATTIQPTSERKNLAYSWEGNTLIIGQNRLLKPGTQYRVTVTTEARDKWGNRLSEQFDLGFTTSMDVATTQETATPEVEPTPTPTAEVVAAADPSPTATPSVQPTEEPSPTHTAEAEAPPATPTPEPEDEPGNGAANGDTPPPPQPTEAPPPTQEPQQEPLATSTEPPPATETPVPAPTETPVPPEPTPEPTATSEPEPEPTPTDVPATEEPDEEPTIEPEVTPTPDQVPMPDAFANVYWRNEVVRDNIGEPVAPAVTVVVEELDFQGGKMLHNLSTGQIFMMHTSGKWEFLMNSAEGELPEFVAVDDTGLWEPGGVLGYIWHSDPYIAEELGLAVSGAVRTYESVNQEFESGQMFNSIDGFIYVLYDSTWWELYPDAGPLNETGD